MFQRPPTVLTIKRSYEMKRVMMIVALTLTSLGERAMSTNVSVKPDSITVHATKYNPVKSQCQGNPLITADGSKINLRDLKSGKIRWIAVSRDLLKHYNYGDTVLVLGDSRVSGKWVIHDTMAPRHYRKIDFLTHPTDKRLSGKVQVRLSRV